MILLLLACTPSNTCDITPPDAGILRSEGTRILDNQGREVFLRGVNAGGRSKFAPYLPFDEGDSFQVSLDRYLDRAASWGIDVMRVPFVWAAMEPVKGQDDTEWLSRYDALIEGAASRGIWTIVDAHQDVYGEMYCGDGFPSWTVENPPAPHHDCADWFQAYVTGDEEVDRAFDDFWANERGIRTSYGEMWSRMATHQQDRPGIIGYEIMNEPYGGSADKEQWAATTLTDFYSEQVSILQAADPDAMVFFDASGLDGVHATTAIQRPVGDNLVFAPHYYDPLAFVGAATYENDPSIPLSKWQALGETWQVPVILGEYGIDSASPIASAYADAHEDALDQLTMHATWWEYSEASEAWNEEHMGLVNADGSENTVLTDAIARPYPALLAGTDPSWVFDGETFTLDYAATPDGVTELRWPSRLGSYTVDVSGGCVDKREDRTFIQALADQVHLQLRRD